MFDVVLQLHVFSCTANACNIPYERVSNYSYYSLFPHVFPPRVEQLFILLLR